LRFDVFERAVRWSVQGSVLRDDRVSIQPIGARCLSNRLPSNRCVNALYTFAWL
jgi:hypothetical protein